jgi:hypothetical protein
MRPDFVPPGQEAAYGIGKTGRFQDYVPGPPPDDLPEGQGGTGRAVPPDLPAPTDWPVPPVVAVPDPGPPASAIMSPGPMDEQAALGSRLSALGPEEGGTAVAPEVMVPPPAAEPAAAQPAAVQPLMVPPPPAEPRAESPEPRADLPPKLTKAEREALAAKAVEEARRLQEEADRHDEEDVPEAGQKGGQAKSAQKPKGK